LARVGTDSQLVVSGSLKEFATMDLGQPLHSFVICGDLHHIEEQMYEFFKKNVDMTTQVKEEVDEEEEEESN
jgi:diphthine synthase